MNNVDIIEINDDQAYNAKLLASALSEPHIRKRGMIDMLGINCALNYFLAKKIKASTQKSVYKVPLLFEEFKITDVYFGNYRIDVITLYKEKNLKIPKIHVDMDILPHFYFFVQIGSKIKEAKMLGFIEGKSVLTCSHDSKYYYPNLNMLFDCERFKELTHHTVATKTLLGKHVDCMGLFLKFMDNDLSSVYKRQLIQHLMNCESCRTRFIDTMDFEKLANNIRYYPDLARKSETITQVPYVDFENSNNGKFANFEENLKNVEIKDVEASLDREDFIEIEKEDGEEEKEKSNTVEMFDLLEKSEKKQLINKNVLDSIFKDIPKMELQPLKQVMSSKNRHIMIVAVLMFLVLGSFVLISFQGTNEIISQESDGFDENAQMKQMEEFNNSIPQTYNEEGKQISLNPQSYAMKAPSIDSKPTYSPTITTVSWEAPESLIKKDSYTNFLKSMGKNVKLNLQNDLLLVSDNPTSKSAKADIRIAPSGEVDSIKISQTSGSRAIDDTIIKVVGDTLKYMKPPSHSIISRPVDVTLVLELR